MKIVVTGAGGFLGWHLRAHLRTLTTHNVVAIQRSNFHTLSAEVADAHAVIHLAGINRGSDEDLTAGNVALAEVVATAVTTSGGSPQIVFASSTHIARDTAYARGKRLASDRLAAAAKAVGANFSDVILPNLFGEHARPNYNSFVATFVDSALRAEQPVVSNATVELLHVQDACAALVAALDSGGGQSHPRGKQREVGDVWALLKRFEQFYRAGELPPVSGDFEQNLFNTYRAAAFVERGPIALPVHTDNRGSLVESVKAHGVAGQVFFSTTEPGVTRGDHYHSRKFERFLVIGGEGRIRLRRLFSSQVIEFDVNGSSPTAIDMPTFWAHNITNQGANVLYTLFWTDSVFDAKSPDTFPEKVEVAG